MANWMQLKRLRESVPRWNQWRNQHPHIRPDLIEAHLRDAQLRGADLRNADLIGADLRDAQLREADLSDAHLRATDLTGTDFSRARLSRVELWETTFGNTYLRDTQGLEDCIHFGPSTLDRRTLAHSGLLPLEFLRGYGLSDWEIEATKFYQQDLTQDDITTIGYNVINLKTADPIQYQSVFLSHSTKDETFCHKLHDALQKSGVRCWFSPEHIRWGDKLRPQLDEAIQQQDRLLLVLTKTSLQSPWVEYEIRRAIEREHQEQRRILFPLKLVKFDVLRDWKLVDDDTGQDLAREVREYFIPDDFTSWQDDAAFEAAFERRLANLRQEQRPGQPSGQRPGGA
ncbi:MAG: hypothetical protein ETSY1_18840 [Candidatus Entotheonella factor]|uniref:TIR domain-containing protein n=1 Tax=Entotheonella factor TaxID=1429438 RepID=W4LL34_ENTF1|nr:MAG: hypothetical protein ETSY1_18840 [Candidatus Entotheonella factor]